LLGQPIEQLRVARRLAHFAKVTRGSDQATTEVPLPDSIDHDPSRQRMPRRRQPKPELAAAVKWPSELILPAAGLTKHRWDVRGDLFAWPPQIDPRQDLYFLNQFS